MPVPSSLLPRSSTVTGRVLLAAGTAAVALGIPLVLMARTRKGKATTAGSQKAGETGKRRKYVTDLGAIGTKVGEEDGGVKEYDVVIIGGGTAGCVLAARLSEDPSISVLLLEAGGSGIAIPETRIPTAYSKILYSDNCYNLWTEPQENAEGKKKYWTRAKMLGGCSSINAMMYQLGAPTDFDEWAKLGGPGAEGWRWEEFKKYFTKFEKFVPHKNFSGVDAAQHGASGPVEVGFFGNFSNVASKFLDACADVGIPRVHDINTSEGCIGATKIMTYIDSKGRRVSTESAYLTRDVLARPNLTIVTGASVTRILFEKSEGEEPRASGAEFANSKEGERYVVKARKEVVLSAGAVHSPHILMHSGIGPESTLTAHSIPVVSSLPGVGAHLQDHPLVNMRFSVKNVKDSLQFLNAKPEEGFTKDVAKALLELVKWQWWGKGSLTCNIGESVAFIRSSDPSLFPPSEYPPTEDSASGENAPDIELFASPLAWSEHGRGQLPPGPMISLNSYLVRPTSYGSITLHSADPFDDPIIDPAYLSTQHDITVLVRSLQIILKIARTSHLSPLFVSPPTSTDDIASTFPPSSLVDNLLLSPSFSLTAPSSVALLEAIVRERCETVYHPTSSARMVPREDNGVVDADLKVYGVKGLRVADASIFPSIVSGHTAAAVIATAEKAADLIKASLAKA